MRDMTSRDCRRDEGQTWRCPVHGAGRNKYAVVVFEGGGFSEVASYHRKWKAAIRAAQRLRNDGGGPWEEIYFRAMSVKSLPWMT